MLGIELQRNGENTLARQIYQEVRERILNGSLPAGEVLPSTRELAKQLSISRNTVLQAYEMLTAEGFIESSQGAPTRVAEGLFLEAISAAPPPEPKTNPRIYSADFRTGQPDLRLFPRYAWLEALRHAISEMPVTYWGYSGPEGLYSLREEIAAWLYRRRGMILSPNNIFITTGSTQALHLVADLLTRKSGGFLIEDPCHTGMRRVLETRGILMRPVPVDEQGILTEGLSGREAMAIYLTPSHQFPLGGILPAGRRAALIRLAREEDFYIIEDDYDSEFRYNGAPVAPFQTLDPTRVVYVGTFSKTMFPAIRIGYVVIPPQLHSRWRHLRTHADVQNPPFEQAALSEFLRSRRFDHHVNKMRKTYDQRRQALLDSLDEMFGDTWRPWGDAAGLHLTAQFPSFDFDRNFIDRARHNGINVTSVEHHCITKGMHTDKLLFGYGHLEPNEIREGIRILYDFMWARNRTGTN
ncbi:MAG: PLP-dependent aminotransferase family protein [Chitinophagales bacterium]